MTPTYIFIASRAPLIRLPDTIRHHLRLLERFHQPCLRTILKIRWSDFVANTEVLELAEVISIEAMVLKLQLRWAGHVSRMEKYHLHDRAVWGIALWIPQHRGTTKAVQRLLEEVPYCLLHRSPSVGITSSWSWLLAAHSPSHYLKIPAGPV